MEFRCKKCNKFLGEMSKGKVHKNIIILCTECYQAYTVYESLANFKKGTLADSSNTGNSSMPDFMNEFFGKKGV